MNYLINLAKHPSKLDWFNNNWENVRKFLSENKMDGIELIFHNDYDVSDIPKNLIYGVHLRYWPMWIDLWKGKDEELIKQFYNEKNIIDFYGDTNKDILISNYKKEIEAVKNLNAEYAVFHVSHVELRDTFTWNFTYTDEEILICTAELVNEAFGEEDLGFTLLFENLWWPGLKLNNFEMTKKFIDSIKYPNKGFMLDIGHMSIVNCEITNEKEACEYILHNLELLGSMKDYIKGIHLNKSISGNYIKQDHSDKLNLLNQCENIWDGFMHARNHILHIDQHIPFDSKEIIEVIESIKPQFLVYELLSNSLDDLEKMIITQNKIFSR